MTRRMGKGLCAECDDRPLIAHTLRADGFDASEDGTGRGTPLVACETFAATLRSGGGPRSHGKVNGTDRMSLVAVNARQDPVTSENTLAGPVDTDGITHAVAFSCKDYGADARTGETPTLRAMGHDGSHANAGGQVAVAMSVEIREREDGRRMEPGEPDVANCLRTPNGGRDGSENGAILHEMTVRRLTPVECERLMGFPDNYTRIPWRGRPADRCPDGPRYKALGNSMAVNCMDWIGTRMEMIEQRDNES